MSEKKLDAISLSVEKTMEVLDDVPASPVQSSLNLKETRKYRNFINIMCEQYDLIKNDADLKENPFILEEVMQRVENFCKNRKDEEFKRRLCYLIVEDYWDEDKFNRQYDYILSTGQVWKKFTTRSVLRGIGHFFVHLGSTLFSVLKKRN